MFTGMGDMIMDRGGKEAWWGAVCLLGLGACLGEEEGGGGWLVIDGRGVGYLMLGL